MENLGVFNSAHGADTFGFRNLKGVHLEPRALPASTSTRIARGEAQLIQGGAINADTGIHTGRSPKDKHMVRDASTENEVWWDNNRSLTPQQFDVILQDFIKHAEGMELFAQDLYGGADPAHRVRARVFTEYAWHSLFIRNLLIRPDMSELASYVPDMTIVDLPSFKADPARHGCRSETIIAIDFSRKIVLIGSLVLCGRDEEVRLHLPELRPAEARRHADALLGECRR